MNQLNRWSSLQRKGFGVTELTDIDDFAVRTVNSCQATASPPSSTTADPGSTCSTAPSSPYSRWELSTVPPRPTIYSNRVGMDPDLPLTRLPVHNPPDSFLSVSVLHATSLIFYAT